MGTYGQPLCCQSKTLSRPYKKDKKGKVVLDKNGKPVDEFVPAGIVNYLAAGWIQFMVHDWFAHGENAKVLRLKSITAIWRGSMSSMSRRPEFDRRMIRIQVGINFTKNTTRHSPEPEICPFDGKNQCRQQLP